MNDIEKIKEKIKKLLALAKSPNPNEAASALRMAQELLAEYKINQSDVNTIEIDSKDTKTSCRDKPPRYELLLFSDIASAFGCSFIYLYGGKCSWSFIGLKHRTEIASYIGQVLLRKLRTARKQYYQSLFRVRSRYTKIKRADDFCLAWVTTVTDKLPAFAGITNEEEKAIELYKNKTHSNLEKLTSIKRSFGNPADYYHGKLAGDGVQLQHGVGVDSRGSLLLEA